MRLGWCVACLFLLQPLICTARTPAIKGAVLCTGYSQGTTACTHHGQARVHTNMQGPALARTCGHVCCHHLPQLTMTWCCLDASATCIRRAPPMAWCGTSPSPPISLEVSTITTRLCSSSERVRAISRMAVVLPTPGRPRNRTGRLAAKVRERQGHTGPHCQQHVAHKPAHQLVLPQVLPCCQTCSAARCCALAAPENQPSKYIPQVCGAPKKGSNLLSSFSDAANAWRRACSSQESPAVFSYVHCNSLCSARPGCLAAT